MALACNIDARGKRYRLVMGIGLLAIGVVMALTWGQRGGWICWISTAAVLIAGAFGLFEARMGWCALRAMGMKTRI